VIKPFRGLLAEGGVPGGGLRLRLKLERGLPPARSKSARGKALIIRLPSEANRANIRR
jgi:hypothetical protein